MKNQSPDIFQFTEVPALREAKARRVETRKEDSGITGAHRLNMLDGDGVAVMDMVDIMEDIMEDTVDGDGDMEEVEAVDSEVAAVVSEVAAVSEAAAEAEEDGDGAGSQGSTFIITNHISHMEDHQP